ncbi:MAG: energy-coupling factor transporter ATPase [Synergistaceae bacterium]|nr:ATP-binding cassette domain-containing protein [Synergistota bacterium]NLM71952.1 energy-coupling factor transporter ATPase [Synergistaceae bacterium]
MSIRVEELSHTYHPGTPLEVLALDRVSMDCGRGEWISVVGHTGSGKSTLAQHLNGILYPEAGKVSVDGIDVVEKSKRMCEVRRAVGLVFQYPEQQLFAEDVLEELMFAPLNWGFPDEKSAELASSSLALVGLDDSYLKRSPFHLSGGERRKVAIASVLAGEPSYLVLDEPTAGLDSWSRRELVALLCRLRRGGMGIVLVTHDLDIALQYSDSMVVLDRGRCAARGTPEAVMEFLRWNPVPGLRLPEIAALSARLREADPSAPLTSDWKTLKKWIVKNERRRSSAREAEA